MNIKNVVVLEDVASDMIEGKTFYEQQECGVGDYFWDSILADIESLILYAGIHQRYFGLYRMLSKNFPYSIYYEISDEAVYVVAVLPVRRNPAWIIKISF